MQAMPGMDTPPGDRVSRIADVADAGRSPPVDARDSFDHSGGFSRSVMPGAEASDGLRLGAIFVEQFEAVETNQGSGSAWDVQAWYGGPFDKAWLRTQGDRRGGRTETASVEALWFRPFHPFWGTQLGARQDFGEGRTGPGRRWASKASRHTGMPSRRRPVWAKTGAPRSD